MRGSSKQRGKNAGGPIKGAHKTVGGSKMKSKGSGAPAPLGKNEIGRKGK